jgi:hypothetical protein
VPGDRIRVQSHLRQEHHHGHEYFTTDIFIDNVYTVCEV